MAWGDVGRKFSTSIGDFFGGGAEQAGQMAGMQQLGAQQQLQLGALKLQAARQEFEQKQREAQMKSPETTIGRTMLALGLPQDAQPDVQEWMKTGSIPRFDNFDNAIKRGELPGPVLPTPEWYSPQMKTEIGQRLAAEQSVLAGGAPSQSDALKAPGILARSNLDADIAAGRVAPKEGGLRVYALDGKDPYKTDGGTGAVLDMFGGVLNTNNPLAGATINLRGQQAGHERAAAVKDYAQAGSPNASAAKTRAELDGITGEGGFTPAAVDNAAARYNLDGTLPPLGMGKGGASARAAILNRAAELATGTSGTDQRAGQIDNKAASTALSQVTKQRSMVASFEKTANANADMALDLSNKVDRTNVNIFNRWLQAGRTGTGSVEAAQFNAANETFVNEYAKIMSGSMGNTAVSDSARNHAHEMLSTAHSKDQYAGIVRTLQAEMRNRMQGFEDQEVELRTRLKGGKGAPVAADVRAAPAASAPSASTPANMPARLTSDADYNVLPPGTRYQAPDGSIRVKR